jgi:hypothetical protein
MNHHTEKASDSITFKDMINYLKSSASEFPDKRTGSNLSYSMEDAVMGAFSLFLHSLRHSLHFKERRNRIKGKVTLRLYPE